MNIIEKAKQYAIKCHSETNHLYDGKPYEYHLQMVFDTAKKLMHITNFIPDEESRNNFLAAAWTHDVIEDCRQTYNDVLEATNKQVAELTYALTNEKGKNRKERANEKYYEGIKKVPNAVLLKVCDRIANVRHSRISKSRMLEMYRKENQDFIKSLNDGSCDNAFDALLFTVNFDNIR